MCWWTRGYVDRWDASERVVTEVGAVPVLLHQSRGFVLEDFPARRSVPSVMYLLIPNRRRTVCGRPLVRPGTVVLPSGHGGSRG
jgi:hypothetical protein